MIKDRTINNAIEVTYQKLLSESDDKLITERNKDKVCEVIEKIIDFQIDVIKQDMLQGATRVVLPRIGKFTKNPNKAILREIRKTVCSEMGYDTFSQMPSDLRTEFKIKVSELALVEFSERKRIRQMQLADTVEQLKKDMNR